VNKVHVCCAQAYLRAGEDSRASPHGGDKSAGGDVAESRDEVETFEYHHAEDADDQQRPVEQRLRVAADEAQRLKLDAGGDDDDEENGEQAELGAEVDEAARRLAAVGRVVEERVVEDEVAADGDQRHGGDEQSNKQARVRLDIYIYNNGDFTRSLDHGLRLWATVCKTVRPIGLL